MEFFSLQMKVSKYSKSFEKNPFSKDFLLPNFSHLLDEDDLAKVGISFDLEGIYISVLIEKPFEDVFFPDIEKGDALEIFIDTRDLKSSSLLTKFSHHFVVLPKPIGELAACEMTKFRSEDSHPLCDPKLLQTKIEFGKKEYKIYLHIPSEALFGYDPRNFQRMGFTYRIHRKGGQPLHFNVSSSDYKIEKHPHLWASLVLGSEKKGVG